MDFISYCRSRGLSSDMNITLTVSGETEHSIKVARTTYLTLFGCQNLDSKVIQITPCTMFRKFSISWIAATFSEVIHRSETNFLCMYLVLKPSYKFMLKLVHKVDLDEATSLSFLDLRSVIQITPPYLTLLAR